MAATSNPFVTHRPVRGDELCGREPAMRALEPLLAEATAVAVAGEPGAGFTSLAGEIARRRGEEGREVVRVDATLAEDGEEAAQRAREAWREAGEPGEALLLADGLGRLGEPPVAEEPVGIPPRGPVVGFGPDSEAAVRAWTGAEPEVVRLGRIPLTAWLPYALERFLETDRWIGDDHVAACVERTGGHPRRTPALLAAVWHRAEEGRVGAETVEEAWGALLGRARSEVLAVLGGLTANQRRVLRGIAREGEGDGEVRPYGSDFLERYGLSSPSSVQRSLESLEARWHVVLGEGGPRVRDPLLAGWLRKA